MSKLLTRLIFRKGAELGYMFLLNTDRKSFMGGSTVPSHLPLVFLKGQSQVHVDFEWLGDLHVAGCHILR